MELLCNLLSPQAKPLIVIQSSSDVRSHGPAGLFGRNWIISPVGRGEFTVEADRVALGPVIERLIDERMAAKRAEGTDLRGNRSYTTSTPSTRSAQALRPHCDGTVSSTRTRPRYYSAPVSK